jgi:threonine dehydrogenase-like Zn-dependent dehydrogenase
VLRIFDAALAKAFYVAWLGFRIDWEFPDRARAPCGCAEYKHVVLGLIFLKYIPDAFEEQHARLEAEKAKSRRGRPGRVPRRAERREDTGEGIVIETARQAFEMLRDGGWATMLGVAPANATVEVPAAALRREKVLTGSSMGSNRFKVDMPRYIDLYYQGKLMLDEMITRRFRLAQVDEAFQAMREGEVIRSVLMFD